MHNALIQMPIVASIGFFGSQYRSYESKRHRSNTDRETLCLGKAIFHIF